MHIHPGRFLSSVALSLATALAALPARADLYTDDFSNGLSPFYWTAQTPGGLSTIAAAGGEILMTQGNDPSAYLEFNFPIQGDFDARLDYRLINWPANNQERIGMILNAAPFAGTAIAAVERISDGGFVSGNEGYAADLLNGVATVPTSDTAGRLRLTRVGQTVSGLFWDGSAWSPIAIYTSAANTPGGAQPLYLPIWWEGAAPVGVQVAFDNFYLDAPGTSIPAVPEPASWISLLAGLVLLAGVQARRAGKPRLARASTHAPSAASRKRTGA